MKGKRLTPRMIKPGNPNKGRENPTVEILVDEHHIKETGTNIIFYPNGTFKAKESSDK